MLLLIGILVLVLVTFFYVRCVKITRLRQSPFMFINVILSPIIKNKIFFTNLILLVIIPSIINAYWINHEQYITISKIYKYGIKIRDGASFPYILFIPFVAAYVLSIISMAIRYFNRSFYKYFKVIVYGFLIFIFVVNVFLLLNFSTMISPSIVQLMIETNSDETTEFFHTYLLSWRSFISYIIIIVMILYIAYSEKKFKKSLINRHVIILCLFVGGYLFQRSVDPIRNFTHLYDCKNLSEAELWYLSYPVNTNTLSNFLYSSYIVQLSKQEIRNALHSTIDYNDKAELEDSINLVLIIGESFSKYHSSLYGYSHFTNPNLQKHVDSGNLFVFTDVISCFNLTSFVLRNLFSVNSIMDNEDWTKFPAFPILFRRAGYNVYLWDNQRTFGKADVSDFSIASYLFNDTIVKESYSAVNRQVFPYDGQLIDDFAHNNSLSENRNLVIFHLMGQHTMPDKRYPIDSRFNVFTMDSVKRDDIDERRKSQIAHYDNATLYNDWVVYDVIQRFEDKNAVILYLSDHGEELYDFRDHYGRTQESVKTPEMLKYQYEIPFMIWCSDYYIENHAEKVLNIASAVEKPFMNDNVCQILMGLVGMKSKYYNSKRDLLSPQYEPYPHRNVQNSLNYESIVYGE